MRPRSRRSRAVAPVAPVAVAPVAVAPVAAAPVAALAATLLTSLLLTGCPSLPTSYGSWDPGAENCGENSPPAIGNVAIDSSCQAFDADENLVDCLVPASEGDTNPDGFSEQLRSWAVVVEFDWVDPGVSGAADAANMLGGYASAELLGVEVPSQAFTRDYLESLESDAQGHFVFPPINHPDGVWDWGSDIDVEVRLRDRCGATSNEKSFEYTIGTGPLSEDGGGDGS